MARASGETRGFGGNKKVPAGEAVDVKTSTGQRWLAVFADKPGGEAFAPTQAEGVWLLR
jgi:hypothetical protein